MAKKEWKTIKLRYCEHAGDMAGLEVKVIYPPEVLPDQPPQIGGHRCTLGEQCMMTNTGNCMWSGSNPDVDPFELKG